MSDINNNKVQTLSVTVLILDNFLGILFFVRHATTYPI